MYVKNVKELILYICNLIKKGTFWFSVKYVFWVALDKVRGIDYVKNEGYDKLGSNPDESSVFQATRDIKYLKKILDDLNISSEDSILDLGCGKGYLMKIFSTYPFRKIGGVEISEKLSKIAEKNLRKEKVVNYKIYNENAMTFNKYADYNYIYMFNPFPSVVMKAVISNLKRMNVTDKKITIIYHHPICHTDITGGGILNYAPSIKGNLLIIIFIVIKQYDEIRHKPEYL